VIILKTFYIFKINKNYISLSKTAPDNMYLLFKSINSHKKDDIIVAYDLLKEISLPINKEFFNEFIYMKLRNNDSYTKYRNVHMYNDYLNNEVSKMNVNRSHIKIKSNKSDNIFINNLSNIDNLFLCDFNNDYYKYLINKEKTILKK